MIHVREFTIQPSPHYNPDYCNIFWGSHGCSKMADHEGVHQCGTRTEDPDDPDYDGGPCTQFITLTLETDAPKQSDGDGAVRYYQGDGEWSEWCPSHWFT